MINEGLATLWLWDSRCARGRGEESFVKDGEGKDSERIDGVGEKETLRCSHFR